MPLPAMMGLAAASQAASAGVPWLAAGGAGAGILSQLLGHPLWGSIMGQMGSKFLGNILGPELPYGQYGQEQLQAISGMLPGLQTAAAGKPTAGTRAIREQVKSEGQRMQQSYATGARRAGLVGGLPGGTAPYRAQQGRVQAATQGAMVQRLGQYQTSAQQTLAGMAPAAYQAAGVSEMADLEARNKTMSALGRFSNRYGQNMYDPQWQEMMQFLKQYYFGTAAQPTQPTGALGNSGTVPASPTYGPDQLYGR